MECLFCGFPEELPAAYKIAELEASVLYLFKDQRYPGRCLLLAKEHVRELFDLEEGEALTFLTDLRRVSAAICGLYGAEKVNLLSLGDGVNHLHIHIVPKMRDGLDWEKMFSFYAADSVLTRAACEETIDGLRAQLARQREEGKKT